MMKNKKVLLQTNSSDKCYAYFDKSNTLANYIINNVYTGTDGENGLYYHDGVGSYTNADQEAGDYSYRYSGRDYELTNKATNAGYTSLYTSTNTETDGVINFYCDENKSVVGENCLYPHYYTTAYNETTYYSELKEALHQAVIDGYLTNYNIKNFVCFGSNDIQCPEDNIYRIIGIFENEVKLIKSTSIGEYAWDSGNENVWNESRKPSIYTMLNTTYYETLSPNWQVLINKVHSWQVGGMNDNDNAIGSVKEVYNNEIGINQNGYEEAMAIGLMYVSDYGYATYPYAWTTDLINYNNSNIIANNWLSSEYEWTITLGIENTRASFVTFPSAFAIYKWQVFSNGDFTKVTNENSIRPCFYLNFDVQYISGTGTQSDPYRIA